jgi:hypothetical protein
VSGVKADELNPGAGPEPEASRAEEAASAAVGAVLLFALAFFGPAVVHVLISLAAMGWHWGNL